MAVDRPRLDRVMRRIDLRGRLAAGDDLDYRALVPRASVDADSILDDVRTICDDVRRRASPPSASTRPASTGSPSPTCGSPRRRWPRHWPAWTRPSGSPGGVDRSRHRVHADQRRSEVTTTVVTGGTVTQRWMPVDRVGLYVPGGLAVYPSSVVMNVVPAQVAGVGGLAVASPPQRDHGGPSPRGPGHLCPARRPRGVRGREARRRSRCSPSAYATATRCCAGRSTW